MPLNDAFEDVPGRGSAETFKSRAGYYYSHQYDEQGAADAVGAAQDYIAKQPVTDAVKRIAHALIASEGPETDLYHYGGTERWVVDAEQHLRQAKHLVNALGSLISEAEPQYEYRVTEFYRWGGEAQPWNYRKARYYQSEEAMNRFLKNNPVGVFLDSKFHDFKREVSRRGVGEWQEVDG